MTDDDRWEIPFFTGLIHDGWSIQKHLIKHLMELSPLKDMYQWYNDEILKIIFIITLALLNMVMKLIKS